MSDRLQKMSDDELDAIAGGNVTYTWLGGQGTCGLNGNNNWYFSDKSVFESTLDYCMNSLGMDDVQTLTYMRDNGIIHKG